MAPWDEPSSKTCYASRRALLQMEKEKVANKVVEEMMNRIKELFQKSVEELALEDEEMLEGQIYEESHQEDPDEDLMLKIKTFDEDEVLILPFLLMKTSSLCSSCTSRREHDEL
jgi:hypothetical protein